MSHPLVVKVVLGKGQERRGERGLEGELDVIIAENNQ